MFTDLAAYVPATQLRHMYRGLWLERHGKPVPAVSFIGPREEQRR